MQFCLFNPSCLTSFSQELLWGIKSLEGEYGLGRRRKGEPPGCVLEEGCNTVHLASGAILHLTPSNAADVLFPLRREKRIIGDGTMAWGQQCCFLEARCHSSYDPS